MLYNMNKIIVFANQKGGAYIIRKVEPVNWHGINGVHLKNKERCGKRGSNP